MKIAITGGGSAGHVVPALSVAAQLTAQSETELVYFGRYGSIEHEYAEKAKIRFRSVPSAGLKRYGSLSNLGMPFTVLRGIGVAWRAMRRERPDAVFSKGGYVTVPVGIAAWLCRVPLVIHESDHSLGLANRILARMADRVCLSEPAPGKTARWLDRKTVVTGLPLRYDLAHGRPEQLRAKLGISPGAEVLLIFCGSSGSARINDAVRDQLDKLLSRFAVIHVRGKGNLDPSLARVPGYWQVEYLHEEMTDALWLADLVIGRAGATTLAELEALDKRTVLVPLPASVSRGDQLVNAEAFARRRGRRCYVVQDDENLTGGATLVAACLLLAETPVGSGQPDPAMIHQAAGNIARETLAAARPRRRRRAR
ncbi:UDP-N-acetylglucosamine--N-acetylmuramyl-(pentapeptide) pyrophosphoryl-undecaprenol N-acetylglucosamine transferase [Streptomyces phaeochromogenes]|uniref:UDP-N-acetylglucosamine--N-acetylmuramyl- (pentapeptide) pyrophosphoryl-undecaprenol N-acetylglucosamine transferase n=1 Tax=Streptomyces phaeochromogenes TaxID=1923 RepID=UPI002E28FE73|nr:UDP-N-acetylglucosamine--N-acetylmuramyl-(pentapeptide) pyrophosphoryl-undecaprenol N-acetylglucosamine transferase [Streptomyces phaeochromogenes]